MPVTDVEGPVDFVVKCSTCQGSTPDEMSSADNILREFVAWAGQTTDHTQTPCTSFQCSVSM
eukprot:3334092-Amphidinium_carterae.1